MKEKSYKIRILRTMKKWLLIFFGLLFLGLNNLEAETTFLDVRVEEAAKGSTKLLNQFNSVESLLQNAGKFSRVKGGAQQAFVKGDGASIFKAISQGGTQQANGTILMKDGTTLFNHFSAKTGAYTLDINRAGQIFKIRITP